MVGQQLEYSPGQPDPYAQPEFPTQDLNEVRPTGRTIRRGRAWIFVGLIIAAMGGIIAFDTLSKASPAKATGAVTAYGVGTVPEPDVKIDPVVADEEKKPETKKGKSSSPPKRKSALGRSDAFENPSQKYAEREVSSWNPSTSKKGSDSIANRRNSALGN